MQKLASLLSLFFFFANAIAQTSVTDDFSDGNFSANPTWVGDASLFTVSASNELQLNHVGASGTSESSLVTSSNTVNNGTWEFSVRLDFSPSTSNYAKVYLASDQQDLTGSLNGYYVRIGGQSSTVDDVKLYRQDGTADTLLIDGIDGTVASSPDIKIRVTKSTSNNWSLFLDQTGSGNNFQNQGTAIENKYSTSSYFGVFCRYTSTRFDKFFFDDIVVSSVPIQDTLKPIIIQVSVTSDSSLTVNFNEKLDADSALLFSNYTVNSGIGNPTAIQFTNTDSLSVNLIFSNKFVNGSAYEIISKNVADEAGNVMINDTTAFTYFVPEIADFRDVVINEVYADPAPSIGLPGAEFLELFNASTKVFDLTGWTFTDGTSTGTLSAQTLQPGEFLILCPQANTTDYATFGLTQGLATFPTLNNSGDFLLVSDSSGKAIDSINYSTNWYRDVTKANGGYTLEQINPFLSRTGESNFNASTATIGGTPGAQNSVFDTLPDTKAPTADSVEVISANSVVVSFSEKLDGSTALNNSNYSLNNGVGNPDAVQFTSADSSEVLLQFANSFVNGVDYELITNNVEDQFGNVIVSDTSRFFYFVPVAATYRDIVINEIYANPTPSNGLPEAEFIELFNASNKVFDLSGWIINDGSNATLSTQILQPGEYITICSQTESVAFSAYGMVQGLSNFPTLTNSGESITLIDNTGQTIDFVNYNSSWHKDDAKDDGGYSLEQINPFAECTGKANFIASSSAIGGTPGAPNSAFDTLPDVTAPNLTGVLILNDTTLSISFDEFMDSLSFQGATYALNPAINVSSVQPTAPDYEEVIIKLQTPLDSGVFYSISVVGATDCSGNEVEENVTFIALPSAADSNDVIVNEVLFNARSGSADFVELYNRSEKVIALKNWQLGDYDFEEDSIKGYREITDQPVLIFPKEYIVLTKNKADILQQYPLSIEKNILEIDDLPTYSNEAGGVYMFNPNTALIDGMIYEDDYHFALLVDDDGVSLERINSEKSSLDETNWHSAAESVGFATPGYKNSQDFTNPKSSGTVSLSPDIISPDGDGFQDILSINYQFNAPGYFATVSIFDRNGRLIKKLVNNELLGAKGNFFWDGITDENTKARIGVYVVLFEALNLNGDTEVFKNVITVASQLK